MLARSAAVSIHAPARGATDDVNYLCAHRLFQSTHPRGVRRGCKIHKYVCFSFQSTHPRGVRHSIALKGPTNNGFQSTHPRGVRQYRTMMMTKLLSFNPRTREGCDTQQGTTALDGQRFNPRTREGCDPNFFATFFQKNVSIHAPARGATRSRCICGAPSSRFQSTHPRGVRPLTLK